MSVPRATLSARNSAYKKEASAGGHVLVPPRRRHDRRRGPGSGRLVVDARPVDDLDATPQVTLYLAGVAVGELLRSLTAAAISETGPHDCHPVDHLWEMATREARGLLPAMQAAVLTAAAGTERAERVLDPPDPEEPRRPFCANCDEGRVDSARNPNPNPWCEKYGHEPFGVRDRREGAWDRAERRYREHRAALEQVSYLDSRRPRNRS